MALAKSFFNGIGSGAGFAWPTFGITMAILGTAVGGPISIILGSVTVIAFLAVSSSIFYLSYIGIRNEELRLKEKNNQTESALRNSIDGYLHSILKTFLTQTSNQNFYNYLQKSIDQDVQTAKLAENPFPLLPLLTLLKEHTDLITNQDNKKIIIAWDALHPLMMKNFCNHYPPLSVSFIAAFFGFIGTFGSTVGCCAGLSGLLTGLGLFSSFAAFPVLGIAILSSALIFATLVAIQSATDAQHHFQGKKYNKIAKKIDQQLQHLSWERELTSSVSYVVNRLKTPLNIDGLTTPALAEDRPHFTLDTEQLFKNDDNQPYRYVPELHYESLSSQLRRLIH